jgi:hypothetical protein
MITLSVEGQQRARDALKKLDQDLATDKETIEAIKTQAQRFRDTFFESFDVIERESLSLNDVMLKMQRIDKDQLQVTNKNYPPFLLILDPELAYHPRPLANDHDTGGKPRQVIELTARLFAIYEPPNCGLLRYYTIFGDGSWKRTTFSVRADGSLHPQSALAPASSADILTLEAIDLLSKACTAHPTWAELATASDTLIAERLRERSFVKIYLTGR